MRPIDFDALLSREAAILSAPLAPGNYTAIVRGSGNTTGVALVEIYQLP